ncbi:MAG: PAS domain S-box protein [Proteobacteria bacterium]|nr:PAS domain S-box protein [Pseudomonadota bacterium]
MSQNEWKEKYLSIIEEIEDGYAAVDLEGNLTDANQALCTIWGYSRDELVGFNHRKFVSEEQAALNFKAYNQVFRTRKPNKSYVYEGIRKNGERVLVDVSISLIKDRAGNPTGFRGIYRDITERRKAQAELGAHKSRLEAIFRSVEEGIVTVNPDMNVIEVNHAARDICGLVSDLKIGRPFPTKQDYCDNACRDVFQEALKTKTSVKEYSIECKRKDQPSKTLVLSSAPLLNADKKQVGAILVVRDVTRLRDLERQLTDRHRYHNIVGKSKKMLEIYTLLDDLTNLETTVLITGENGTGKEVIAKALHFSGNRAFKPLVTVNCSALAENLLESELFGHIKGAFTGAIKDREGRFKTADKGTILLDEIGDISPRIQLKLLRVLQEKEFEPVGSSKPSKVDVRMIACTNRDLKDLVDRGEFREDLYYRLKVIEIGIPPLRDRRDDIALLFDHFRKKYSASFTKNIVGADENVMKALMNYHWPGNVRELEHAVERAFILCHEPTIRLDHLPPEIVKGVEKSGAGPLRKTSDDPDGLLSALEKTGWNKAKAARLLGISRQTVYRKIHQHNLKPTSEEVL